MSAPRTFNPKFLELVASTLQTGHEVVMSHGDLHPSNILVEWESSTSLVVTGIVDWELSGAYPEYWDYVKALHWVKSDLSDWYTYIPTEAIGNYQDRWIQDCFVSRLHI